MTQRIFTWLSLLTAALLTGCATQLPMALSNAAAPKADKVTVLMSASLNNQYKPGYQPNLLVVNIEKPGAKEKADRLNFKPDEQSLVNKADDDSPKKYLLSFELDPGQYILAAMTGLVRSFPINGVFQSQLMQDVSFQKPGVYYVGHVEAVVRERKDDEERAGPLLPLIDQAISGASGGTFDVAISDRWSTDEVVFKTRFPVLAAASIEKQLLAPHDKLAVKARWEALVRGESTR